MSDLLNRLREINADPSVKSCTMGRIISELDAETAEALKAVMENPKVSNRVIHQSLAAEGFKVSREVVSQHRNGYCRCSIGKDSL